MSSSATMQQAKTEAAQPAQHQQSSASAIQSQFADLRPQASAQRQLQEAANSSPQSSQLKVFQQMVQNSARATQLKAMSAMMNAPAVQRAEEDDEPLQAKSENSTVQRISNPESANQENTVEKENTIDSKTERTKPQMQKDVDSAKLEVEELVNSSETSGEVEAFFPALKEKYQLKKIFFNDSGEIDIEINPKAKIDAKKLVKTGLSFGSRTMDVTFKTGTLSGSSSVVGTSMIADPIGPNHPQGGPPKSSSQTDLMGKLETEKSNESEEKYIRGHLLNDNIGGPGVDENLFPLTGRANRQHHDEIEAQVKEWVNVNKYWVYYSVEVKNISVNLKDDIDENYVNADFVCRAYPLASDGAPSKLQLNKTIKSEKSANVAPVTRPNLNAGGAEPERDISFVGSPELSTSKKAKKGQPTNLDDLLENLKWLHEENELAKIIHLDGIAGGTLTALIAYFENGTEISERIKGILATHAAAIYGKVADIAIEDDV